MNKNCGFVKIVIIYRKNKSNKMKPKIIIKKLKSKCYYCLGRGCSICHNTGKYQENYYIIIGKKIAIDMDTLK